MNQPTANRPCPVCASTDSQSWLQKDTLQLVRCARCSMIYANPVAPDLATGAYYDLIGENYYLSPAKLQSDYAEVRFERELRLFRKHCRSGAVLDVGCSTGAFLYQLNQRFPGAYQTLGMDASGPALEYAASRGIRVCRGQFLEHDFGEKRFDAVTFWAVLEHLMEPRRFLEKAADLLSPDGVCLALVPNMNSFAARILGARYRYIYPQHLNYFTAETLGRLAESWFKVISVHSTHFNPLVIWQDWKAKGAEVSNLQRAELLQRTTAYKQNPWLRPVKVIYRLMERGLGALRLADNLVAVLQKKSDASE